MASGDGVAVTASPVTLFAFLPLPHRQPQLRMSSGRGPGTLHLSYDPLAAAAEAEAEADPPAVAGGGGDWVPPLDLAVPVTVISGPLAPRGYHVASRTHQVRL